MLTRREELLRQARRPPEVVVDQLLAAEQQVEDLRVKVRQLEEQQALNSTNSSKPPASDGLAKPPPRSLRAKSGRKPGGQPGHPGRTLEPVKTPDHVAVHTLSRCPCGQCGGVSLHRQPVLDYERRQVFDLPPLRLSVTEHQAEIKQCPVSGRKVSAAFPPGVEAPVQYGPHFRGLTLYLFNQHLLRELKFLAEEQHQAWAAELSRFLIECKDDPLTQLGLDEDRFKQAHAQYQSIVRPGRRHHPRRKLGQGRTPQDKATNLLDRLEDYDLCVLAFLLDPKVPFTNNQGEQDIRMIKVKQKISGGFRTLTGARVFARIRSYLSTCRKQGRNLWEACQQLVIGQPFMPNVPVAGP